MVKPLLFHANTRILVHRGAPPSYLTNLKNNRELLEWPRNGCELVHWPQTKWVLASNELASEAAFELVSESESASKRASKSASELASKLASQLA